MTVRVQAFTADGTRLAVQVDGGPGSPAVLLLNSIGCDLRLWDEQVGVLAEEFTVVRFDARGHGGSQPAAGPLTIDHLADDGLRVLDAVGMASATVAGVSMGGLVAMAIALRAPERVDRLVVANSAARIGSKELWSTRAATVRRQGMAAVVEQVLERFFTETFRVANPRDVERFRRHLLAMDAASYAACCDVLRDADLRDHLGSITTPTLAVAGEVDEATPVAQSREVADGVKDGHLLVVGGAAHLANVERPDAFNNALRVFLKTRGATDGVPPHPAV